MCQLVGGGVAQRSLARNADRPSQRGQLTASGTVLLRTSGMRILFSHSENIELQEGKWDTDQWELHGRRRRRRRLGRGPASKFKCSAGPRATIASVAAGLHPTPGRAITTTACRTCELFAGVSAHACDGHSREGYLGLAARVAGPEPLTPRRTKFCASGKLRSAHSMTGR
jgi:hypothetical protein